MIQIKRADGLLTIINMKLITHVVYYETDKQFVFYAGPIALVTVDHVQNPDQLLLEIRNELS